MKRLAFVLGLAVAATSITGCSCWSGCVDRYSVYFETCAGCHEPWHPCEKKEKKCRVVEEKPAIKCERPVCNSCGRCHKSTKRHRCDPCETVTYVK